MRDVYLVVPIIVCITVLHAQQSLPPEHVTRERLYDVLHYRLDITIDEKQKKCVGDATIRFIPLRPAFGEVRLDAADLSARQIKLGRKQLDFHQVGETLFVALDKAYGLKDTLDIVISYSVTQPKRGMYFITPDSGSPNTQYQVWTQGEPEDNHYWFPCYDFPNDMATSEMIITVNDRFTAISNGKLLDVKKDLKSHTATYHWSESKPHVTYLISLVVGEYVEVKDSWGTVPISNYVYPHQRADAMRSFRKTPEMMEFFSTTIGYPYPWEKYAQTVVADFVYSGEENVSATTLTDATIHDSRAHLDYSSDGLVAHELAHQWWGNLLTCKDWSHAWLNEGFATYFENLFVEHDRGRDEAAKGILDNQITIVNADAGERRRPTVWNRYHRPMELFDNRIYGKGAIVLDMLRYVLGDELFRKAIHHYVRENAFRCVETNDFEVAVEEATGYNLRWFFNQWVYTAGYPEFDVVSTWDQASRTVQLNVKQVQPVDSLTGIFRTPIDIEVWMHHAPETYRVEITRAEESFSFPAYQQPQLIIFDKGNRILKKANFRKSINEWIYQLQHAEDAVDRILAIEELRWMVDSASVGDAIAATALDDRFWGVRQEAVWALGEAKRRDYSQTLMSAYGDRSSKVRAASVASLGNYTSDAVLKTLQHAFESDSSYSVAAAALQSLARVDTLNRVTYCGKALQRSSRGEVIRSTALQILAGIGDETALDMITAFTKYGVERNLRVQAINLIATMGRGRSDVVPFLVKLLNDPSYHVRKAVIGALGGLGNDSAIEPLRQRLEVEPDSRLVKDARDAIARIQQAQESH